MSRINGLLARLAPDGVPFVPIGQFADCVSGATPASGIAAYWENGSIPWMSSGETSKGTVFDTATKITPAGFESCSTKMVPAGAVVVALAGQGKTRGTVARIRIPLCTNQSLCAIVVRGGDVDSDFLFHYLRGQYQQLRSASSGEGARGGLNLQIIRAYRVPVPPREVQAEIVRILDSFHELEAVLEAELEAEITSRQAQRQHLRKALLAPSDAGDWQQVRLDEAVTFVNGKPHERLTDPEGSVALMTARFISTGGIATRFVHPENALTLARHGDVALVMSDLPGGRALGRAFFVPKDGQYTANQRVCLLRSLDTSRVLPRYLYHAIDRNEGLLAFDNGMDQTHLKKSDILGVTLNLPPIEHQKRASSALDRLDEGMLELVDLLNSEIAVRRQQYEHYRDRLLTFKEAPA